MKKRILSFVVFTAIIAACVVSESLWVGCATEQQVTPSTNAFGVVTYQTNTVVNPANLALDAAVLQGITATAVTVTLTKDPAALPIIQDIATAFDGVINGANTNSVSQILAVAGQKNAALGAEIAPVVNIASSLEQQMIVKYGASTGGQIALALTKSADAGIKLGLLTK